MLEEVTKYEPITVVKEIMAILVGLDNGYAETPTGLSKKIDYDKRTVEKYLNLLAYLDIVKFKKINAGHRKIKLYYMDKNSKFSK